MFLDEIQPYQKFSLLENKLRPCHSNLLEYIGASALVIVLISAVQILLLVLWFSLIFAHNCPA